jgi:hypothetical protein
MYKSTLQSFADGFWTAIAEVSILENNFIAFSVYYIVYIIIFQLFSTFNYSRSQWSGSRCFWQPEKE